MTKVFVIWTLLLSFAAGLYIGKSNNAVLWARLWWLANDPHRGPVVEQYDVTAKTLELRQRLGPMLGSITPAHGRCSHCGWPWLLTEEHVTTYAAGRGMFPLCRACFRGLRELGRDDEIVKYYRALAGEWERHAVDHGHRVELTPDEAERVVLAELAGK